MQSTADDDLDADLAVRVMERGMEDRQPSGGVAVDRGAGRARRIPRRPRDARRVRAGWCARLYDSRSPRTVCFHASHGDEAHANEHERRPWRRIALSRSCRATFWPARENRRRWSFTRRLDKDADMSRKTIEDLGFDPELARRTDRGSYEKGKAQGPVQLGGLRSCSFCTTACPTPTLPFVSTGSCAGKLHPRAACR